MRTRSPRIALVIGALLVVAACGDDEKSPTGGSPVGSPTGGSPVVAAPDGPFYLHGFVSSIAGSPLADARVEAASGAGTFDVVTDKSGYFLVSAAGETALRVEKEGFRTLAKTVTVNREENIHLMLTRSEAGGATGEYTLTFTASDTCSLPPDATRRVYEVAIEEVEQALYVSPRVTQPFVSMVAAVGFRGTRAGDAVTFRISDCPGFAVFYEDEVCFVERIPSVGDLGFAGTATGTITGPRITATFSGTLSIDQSLSGVEKSACTADDHRMEFVRTGA